MSSQEKLDEEKLDEEKLDEEDFDLDNLGVVGQGEGEEFVEQGEGEEFVEQGEVSVGQGDKQPDNKRKRSEWSEKFLAEQNTTPEYIQQRQRSKQRQEEGLRLKDVKSMNEEIGDFTEEDVKAIGSFKRQKKTGGSRKKRSKSNTRSRKQSKTQKRSKSKTRSMKQKRSKNCRR
jgi:hypothetical protein